MLYAFLCVYYIGLYTYIVLYPCFCVSVVRGSQAGETGSSMESGGSVLHVEAGAGSLCGERVAAG